MSRSHGRHTRIRIDGVNISPHCNTSSVPRAADVHETTGYGADWKANDGGLKSATISIGGSYDNDETTGPGVVLKPRLGTTVTFDRRVEGDGVGKPRELCQAVLNNYQDTAPVAGMVEWSATLTVDGDIDDTEQDESS